MLKAAHGLRQGVLLAGRAVAQPPRLFLGAAGDPERDLANPDRMPFAEKADAGVDFVQTQPIFDLDRLQEWLSLLRVAGLVERVAILAGVFLLDSARRAEFVASVPGVVMPATIRERMASATDEAAEGIRLAVELVGQLADVDGVRGVHLMGIDATRAMREVVEKSVLARHVGP